MWISQGLQRVTSSRSQAAELLTHWRSQRALFIELLWKGCFRLSHIFKTTPICIVNFITSSYIPYTGLPNNVCLPGFYFRNHFTIYVLPSTPLLSLIFVPLSFSSSTVSHALRLPGAMLFIAFIIVLLLYPRPSVWDALSFLFKQSFSKCGQKNLNHSNQDNL